MVPWGRGIPAVALIAMLAACATSSEETGPLNASPPNSATVALALTQVAPTSSVAATAPTIATSAPIATPGSSAAQVVSPASPASTAAVPRTVSLAFSGDTLPHSPLWQQARRNAGGAGFDFRPMFAPIAPIVSAVDLAVCHLETPIAPVGEEYSTMPYYGVPAEIADALAATGYDRCSTASNHTADRGSAGIDRTVDVLESVGIAESGMARTPREIEPAVFEVGGVRMTHLSYTFSYNGLSLPNGEAWRSALIDPERIVADATTARSLGAEFVFVSLHWGVEGRSAVTADQRRIAEEITASGMIDLVVGHHAHVLQPIEQINGVWVVFGLGNILSNLPTSDRWPASSQDGAIVTTAVTVGPEGVVVERPVVHPTWVDKGDGWLVRPVAEGLASPDSSKRVRAELARSLDRTSAILGDFIAPAE